MIRCSDSARRRGAVLDVGVVMVASQTRLTEQTSACFGCAGTHGNHL